MSKIITVDTAVELLKRGEVVAIPTETVYGLAADATNSEAVTKVYKAKNRPTDNPLICHFYSLEHILEYIDEVDKNSLKIIKNLCPGSLSVLLNLKQGSGLEPATAGQETVLCRIPDDFIALEIIKKLNKPIAAPSANTSGKYSGTTAKMVIDDLGSEIAGVVDGGNCKVGLESTIVDVRDGIVKILRPGAISKEQIEQIIEVKTSKDSVSNEGLKSVTPGSKYKHYSPTKPVELVKEIGQINTSESSITPREIDSHFNIVGGETPEQFGASLYRNLYIADQQSDTKIIQLLLPELGDDGTSKAIINRVSKMLED